MIIWIKQKLILQDKPIRSKIFHALLFLGAIVSLITGIANIFVTLPWITIALPLFSVVYFLGMHIYAVRKNELQTPALFSFIYLIVIFIPAFWFLNGGTTGGFQYLIPFIAISMVAIVRGKIRWILSALLLIIVFLLIAIEYYHPEYILGYPTREDRYLDIIIAFAISYIAIMVVPAIYFFLYDATNRKLENKNQLLEQKNAKINQQKSAIQKQTAILKKNIEKLKSLIEFKQAMTGMLVHDLKNPLNLIIHLTNDRRITQAGNDMLNIVLNILDISAFENTKLKLNICSYRLNKIINNAIIRVELLMEQKSLTIINLINSDIYVNVDVEILERVFVNLLTNAIKYSPNNDTITLSVQKSDENFIQINIADNGVGIPEKQLHIIFEKYAQVASKKTGAIRSTGLGLAFCKYAIEAHGGEIWVASKYGSGSVFSFTLGFNNIEITESKDIQSFRDNNISLSVVEKKQLEPMLRSLKHMPVYEASEIFDILNQAENQENPNIEKWKQSVKKAVLSGDKHMYKKLIHH